MTGTPPPRPTLRQRWHRLRTSLRLPFLLFIGLLVAGGLLQAYWYWWGVRIQRMVARHTGSTNPYPPYPDSLRYPNAIKRIVRDRLIRPLETVNAVSLNSTPTSPIPASDLALLEGVWSLSDLTLWGPIESDGWRQVGRLHNLRQFSIIRHDQVVRDGDMEQLARLSKMWSLNLTEVSIEFRGLRHFARHPSLKRLGIHSHMAVAPLVAADSPEKSAPLPQVRPESDIAAFREFASNRTLKRLTLSVLPDFGNEHLLAMSSTLPDGTEPLPSLTGLSLNGTGVTGDGLRFVNNLPRLELLELTGNRLGDDGLRELKHNSTIQVLHLSRTQIGDRDVETLLTMSKLQTVAVCDCGITDQGLLRLATHPTLKLLYVGADVSEATMKSLRGRLDVRVLR